MILATNHEQKERENLQTAHFAFHGTNSIWLLKWCTWVLGQSMRKERGSFSMKRRIEYVHQKTVILEILVS